jgi:hypothetical protein
MNRTFPGLEGASCTVGIDDDGAGTAEQNALLRMAGDHYVLIGARPGERDVARARHPKRDDTEGECIGETGSHHAAPIALAR